MPKRSNKVTRKKNAEIVVNTLKFLQCATLNDIVKCIAASYQVDPENIKESVKIILHKGVKYGYVEKRGPKYSIDGFISSDESDTKLENACYRKHKPQKKQRPLWQNIECKKKRV